MTMSKMEKSFRKSENLAKNRAQKISEDEQKKLSVSKKRAQELWNEFHKERQFLTKRRLKPVQFYFPGFRGRIYDFHKTTSRSDFSDKYIWINLWVILLEWEKKKYSIFSRMWHKIDPPFWGTKFYSVIAYVESIGEYCEIGIYDDYLGQIGDGWSRTESKFGMKALGSNVGDVVENIGEKLALTCYYGGEAKYASINGERVEISFKTADGLSFWDPNDFHSP